MTSPEEAEKLIVLLLAETRYVDAVQTYRKLKTRCRMS
jgi:hypothetical protein